MTSDGRGSSCRGRPWFIRYLKLGSLGRPFNVVAGSAPSVHFQGTTVTTTEAIDALLRLLQQEQTRIVRLWAKRLRRELQEIELPGRDIRAPLAEQLASLIRLLETRGEDALWLWPETIRAHGGRRYDQRFNPDDLARELKGLELVLLQVYARHHDAIDPAVAEVIAELIGEAQAAVHSSYARVLRTEEVRFREAAVMETILQHVDVGILLIEPDGEVVYATPSVGRLTGLPTRSFVGPSQALAASLRQLNARHLDGRPVRLPELPSSRSLEANGAVLAGWMSIRRLPDGAELIVEMAATPIWEEHEERELAGVVLTLTDRTESAQRSRELSKAYEELQRLQGRLMQRTRVHALGHLAGDAAHTLNNFLNVLRLRLTLYQRDGKREHIDALDRTVQNIGELVARLQELAQGDIEDEMRVVDLTTLTNEAIDFARPELESLRADVRLSSKVAGQAVVTVDVALMREIIVNLVLAAAERAQPGGQVEVTNEVHGDSVSLRVRSTGSAFMPEEEARLFDPLKARSASPQLFLLLAVGRAHVRRWGGELSSEPAGSDNEGWGMVFRLNLPLVARQQRADEPVTPPKRRAQSTRHVLVVDDDIDNARMLAQLLEEEGYETMVAHSGSQALQCWEAGSYDAALLDVVMPDMSGWELARRLRTHSGDVLLAMITGADVRGQNRSNLALVDAVFRKPIDIDALDEFLSGVETRRDEENMPTLHG